MTRSSGSAGAGTLRSMTTEELRRYWIEDLSWGWSHQSQCVFDFLCRAREAARGRVLLDAGAGHQRYKPFFADAMYLAQEHQAGVDMKRIQDYHILGDVKRLPVEDGCIDIVLSTVAIEHIRYPVAFFEEAFRILRPGGSLWVQAPFVYNEHEQPYDFQRPTRYGLLRWFEDAGFEDIEVQPTSSSTDSICSLAKYALDEDIKRLEGGWLRMQMARTLRSITKRNLALVRRVFDRGPCETTTMPLGWLSVGRKAGASDPREIDLKDTAGFVRDHAEAHPAAIFDGDVLIWDDAKATAGA